MLHYPGDKLRFMKVEAPALLPLLRSRAQGDVLVDQIAYLKRCGFDSFAPEKTLNPADVEAALSRWPEHYQGAADGAVPIWKLRHG